MCQSEKEKQLMHVRIAPAVAALAGSGEILKMGYHSYPLSPQSCINGVVSYEGQTM